MKRRLFNKLYSKKQTMGGLGCVIAKLLIILMDFPFLIIGIDMMRDSDNPYVNLAGFLITVGATILYVFLNMKKLVPWSMDLQDSLFKIFYRRGAKFYIDYNCGLIK